MKIEGLVRRGSNAGSSVTPKRSPESILELKSEINRLTSNMQSTYQADLSQEQSQRNSRSTYDLNLDSACLKSRIFVHYCSVIKKMIV